MPPEVKTAEVPVQLTKTAQDTTPAQEVVTEPQVEPDYKALQEATAKELTETKAAAAKTEQRLRSAEGVTKQRLNIEAELALLRQDTTWNREHLGVIAQAIATGDTEALNKNLGDLASRRAQQQAQSGSEKEVARLYNRILRDAAVMKVDIKTADNFEEVRSLWDKGFAAKDIESMRQATDVSEQLREEYQKADIEERINKEADTRATKKLAAAGIYDSPAIRASGAGAKGIKELEAAVASGQIALTPAIKAQLEKHWNS